MSDATRSLLWSLAKAALVAYGLFCLMACAFQSKLIWFPGEPPRATPAVAGLSHREVELRTKDGVNLHAWLVTVDRPKGVVLYCHGNAGSIEHRIDAAAALARMGLCVLLFDYRGYGRSEGSPSEEGTYLDAEAAWEHLTSAAGFAPERIVGWGESLGAAVCAELARRRPIGALVTESAFTSLADVAKVHYRWLPVRWLLRVRYDTLARVGEVRVPWLLLHSPDDEIVPFVHSERLLEAIRAARSSQPDAAPVELVRTRFGHNDGGFLRDPAAEAALTRFLSRALP